VGHYLAQLADYLGGLDDFFFPPTPGAVLVELVLASVIEEGTIS